MPDAYRGPHRGPDAGSGYADEVRTAIAEIERAGRKLGAFMAESLIGCGGRGSAVFKNLISAGGQPIAACDAWQNRRERWAQQIKGTPYADFREMLARDDLDAVAVASTDCWHVHHTVAAAKAATA